jgi:hypothetical protein
LYHSVAVALNTGAPVKFQMDINSLTGRDIKAPMTDFLPDEADFDAASITCYNRLVL